METYQDYGRRWCQKICCHSPYEFYSCYCIKKDLRKPFQIFHASLPAQSRDLITYNIFLWPLHVFLCKFYCLFCPTPTQIYIPAFHCLGARCIILFVLVFFFSSPFSFPPWWDGRARDLQSKTPNFPCWLTSVHHYYYHYYASLLPFPLINLFILLLVLNGFVKSNSLQAINARADDCFPPALMNNSSCQLTASSSALRALLRNQGY